ncbi:hypothetical protein [Pyrobaculum sp.]|uniref:hypothetical protein n=1 Tax=Pyrobaculum sp. TaxID=2004705 RepID=UPI003D0E8848
MRAVAPLYEASREVELRRAYVPPFSDSQQLHYTLDVEHYRKDYLDPDALAMTEGAFYASERRRVTDRRSVSALSFFYAGRRNYDDTIKVVHGSEKERRSGPFFPTDLALALQTLAVVLL